MIKVPVFRADQDFRLAVAVEIDIFPYLRFGRIGTNPLRKRLFGKGDRDRVLQAGTTEIRVFEAGRQDARLTVDIA